MRSVRCAVACLAATLALCSGLAAASAAVADASAGALVSLNNREIVTLRARLGGESPEQRAAHAQASLRDAAGRAAAPVSLQRVGAAMRVDIGEQPAFFLVHEDLGQIEGTRLLDAGAQKVRLRVEQALAEAREARDPGALMRALGVSAAATVVLLLALWLLRRAGAQVTALVDRRSLQRREAAPRQGLRDTLMRQLPSAARALVILLRLALVLVAIEIWGAYVLQQFAYTRPWGEQASGWFYGLLQQFALAAAQAVPGLLTAALIFVGAGLLTRGLAALADDVERGELRLGWIHADTADATRRVASVAVWLFALALAYPHLPGAGSESFKGVTVLAGLMLSLGASGIVGQAMSGLTLTYSRNLRKGEYIRVGDTEGTVASVGLFMTRVHTGLGEEVSLPNAYIVSQPVRNFSRLVADGQFMLQASVTIGYATPWRQVHALLLEAARRTPGVAGEPAPVVMQTALSDFYVEYRLCAQGDRSAPQRRAEAISQLNGHIQDVFNENGVQIMSPHYRNDPAAPQVVPPGQWFKPRRGPLAPPDAGDASGA